MLKILLARLQQKHRTSAFPDAAPVLPERFRGLMQLPPAHCPDASCTRCVDVCPTDAIARDERGLRLDLGRCLFCPECERACPEGSIRTTGDYRLAVRRREDLLLHNAETHGDYPRARELDAKLKRLFGRSLKLRVVSAGSCNACEADVNVLGTVVFDLARFGIQYVASPRHADGILVTGPITENMRLALARTWEAVPAPKLVIAVGACAISGGPYAGHPETHDGAAAQVPVDLFIPGCPPHPFTILDGLLRLLGQIDGQIDEASGRSERTRPAIQTSGVDPRKGATTAALGDDAPGGSATPTVGAGGLAGGGRGPH